MILAAGYGTRLQHLTNEIPKPLVLYKGKPMIENVISKLESFGISNIYINIHHHSSKMDEYFSSRKRSISEIILLHEKDILGTGGALKNAEYFLSKDDNFLVYNTDVECDIDLNEFEEYHFNNDSKATLAVQNRKTSRYLLAGNSKELIGRTENNKDVIYRKINELQPVKYAFCGIHIINKSVFDFILPHVFMDIIPVYMNMIQNGLSLRLFDVSGNFWKDLGIPENL
jgi:N-acetyl-alpha-D-muramate 1-phosphate uridylyltransferase